MIASDQFFITAIVWFLIGWLAGRFGKKHTESWLAGWGAGWNAAHRVDDVTADDAPTYRVTDEHAADQLIRETGGRP